MSRPRERVCLEHGLKLNINHLIHVGILRPGAKTGPHKWTWGHRYAYASQFDTPIDRAHRGKAKINARLEGDCDPDEWELPPKPKWMRWHTYDKHVEKFDHYEAQLNALCLRTLRRILNQN